MWNTTNIQLSYQKKFVLIYIFAYILKVAIKPLQSISCNTTCNNIYL